MTDRPRPQRTAEDSEPERARPPSWWSLRWSIASAPSLPRGRRTWALAEILCALATLGALGAALATLAWSRLGPVPWWLHGWPMQVLLAGAVGYGTNFLAVRMLFQPRERVRTPPLAWIWPQGLIPAKQAELAQVIGEEVAAKLLTPEAIVSELTHLVEVALDDEATVERIQAGLLPLLERELPLFVERFLPDTVDALHDALEETLSEEELQRTLLDVLDDWFSHKENHAMLAEFLLGFLRGRTEGLVEVVRAAVRRYAKSTGLRRLAIGAGEVTRLIDWDAFQRALRKQLDKPASRRWALAVVDGFAADVHRLVASVLDTSWLAGVRRGAGDLGMRALRDLAGRTLIPRVVALTGSERFRAYLRDELVPRAKPVLVAWIRDGRLAPLLARFDVRRRVASAAAGLDVAELETMANRVGAEHFGAIQVLGYALGLAAGGLLALLGAVG